MNYQQQNDEERQIYFSGEIRDGQIIGLTATDNLGSEYEITIHLKEIGAKVEEMICWDCGLNAKDRSSVMVCHIVPCQQGKS